MRGQEKRENPILGLQPLFTVSFPAAVVLSIKPQLQRGGLAATTTALNQVPVTALSFFLLRPKGGKASLVANSWVFLQPLLVLILHIPLLISL